MLYLLINNNFCLFYQIFELNIQHLEHSVQLTFCHNQIEYVLKKFTWKGKLRDCLSETNIVRGAAGIVHIKNIMISENNNMNNRLSS